MLFKMFMSPFWNLVKSLVSFFPESSAEFINTVGSTEFVRIGLYFLPVNFLVAFLGSVTFWLSANLIWAIVEWVYKKIPGVS